MLANLPPSATRLRTASPSSYSALRFCLGLPLLGLWSLAACGDGGDSDPAPRAPEMQRAPATPAAPAMMPPNGGTAASSTDMPAASPPAAAASGAGNAGTGSETSPAPVGLAAGGGQGPAGSSSGQSADAGSSQPVTPPAAPPPVEPPPVEPPPAAFSPCPSDGTPCAIMPLGDSITFGVGSSGGGYRVELFRQALADQHDITFVGTAAPNGPNQVGGQPFPRAHQGHSGFTISGGGAGSLAGLVDAAIDSTDPDIVLLMIGTNDVNGNIDLANAPNRLGALLDKIIADAPDALLVVGQIIPTTNAQTNTRVQAYNAAIPALVQARAAAGKHIELVDLFTPFNSNPNFAGLMNDGLHPNDAGYVVLAQSWYAEIADLLPQR